MGDEAIEKIESDPELFSAVITDIRMPGSTNGWDVGRRARELLPLAGVLYVSGDSVAKPACEGGSPQGHVFEPFALDAAVHFVKQHT